MTSSDAREKWGSLAPPPEPLTADQDWNVFLSYRSVNRTWVVNLYDVLRQHGHKVFLDQARIVAGDQLITALEDALSRSRAGVLVWSSSAADSDWVKREYQVLETQAQEGEFRFVPVRLDDAKLPVFARLRVFLDFSQYPDGPNGGELLRLLHAVVGKPLSDEAIRFADEQDESARRFTAQLRAAVANGSPAMIQELFTAGGLVWETSSALACAAAEGLTKLKQYAEALDVLAATVQRFPRAIRPKQLQALALARRGGAGDLDRAQAILGELYELGERDPETAGIYARTWMDKYASSKNPLDLRRSRNLYAEAFDAAPDDYYTGINAAAKSILLATPADIVTGRAYAERVQKLVGTESVQRDYWKTATVAEVQLLLGNYELAAKRYTDAVAMAPTEIGSHESTWTQAGRLMNAVQPSPTPDQRAVVRSAFAHLPEPAG